MWKRIMAFIGCILLLQGCISNISGELKKQEKEKGIVSEGLNKQLLQAAEHREADTISKLIKKGANINAQDSKGRTATMIATYNNDVETAKVLIKAGADVNIKDDMKTIPSCMLVQKDI